MTMVSVSGCASFLSQTNHVLPEKIRHTYKNHTDGVPCALKWPPFCEETFLNGGFMALNQKYRILMGFFFVLGTVSCTKDTEKVVYQPLTNHYQLAIKDSQGQSQDFENAEKLDIADSLTIGSLQTLDFTKNPLIIRVQSKCSSEVVKGELHNDFRLTNRTSIPVINMISKEALVLISEQPLICDFEISLTGQNTVTNIYQLNSVKVFSSPQFNNVPFFTEDAPFYKFEDMKIEALPNAELYHLQCSDFYKTAPGQQEPFTWEQFVSLSAVDQSVWSSSSQLCRFYAKSNDQVFLSKAFHLLFTPQPLHVESSLRLMGGPDPLLVPRKVLNLRMSNPNDYPVRLKVSGLANNHFVFRPVYASGNPAWIRMGDNHIFPLNIGVYETERINSVENDEMIVTIPPQKEINVEGIAHVNMNCASALLLENLPKSHYDPINIYTVFVGLNFGLDTKLAFALELGEGQWENFVVAAEELKALNPFDSPILPSWDLYIPQVKALMPRDGSSMVHIHDNEEFKATLPHDQRRDYCK